MTTKPWLLSATALSALFLAGGSAHAQCATEDPGTQSFTEHSFFDRLAGDPGLLTINTPLTIDTSNGSTTATNSLAVELADVDEDGTDDLILGGSAGIVVLFLDVDASVRRSIRAIEVIDDTSACYDIAVRDFDNDGHLDIAVARNGNMDVVLQHGGIASGGGPAHSSGDYYPSALAQDLDPSADFTPPAPPGLQGAPTRGIWANDIDQDGTLSAPDIDLILTGDKVRYWRNDGSGNFTWTKSYAGSGRVSLAEDLNGDGEPDLIKAGVGGAPDEIWLNTGSDTDPFSGSTPHQTLTQVAASTVDYQRSCTQTTGNPPLTTITLLQADANPFVTTMEFTTPDLDGDGDPDLVIASRTTPNAAYINDGTGTFGCKQTGTFVAGEPAWIFPDVTADWSGFDGCMMETVNTYRLQAGESALPKRQGSGCTIELDVPGVIFSDTTGVDAGDLNGDAKPDVAFSNRNDLQEIFLLADAAGLCNTDPAIQPLVCDAVFINTTTVQDELSFSSCVEMIMEPNDGTGYAELRDVDDDGNLDWVDANFSHNSEGWVNRVYWGTGNSGALSCTSPVQAAQVGGLEADDLLIEFGEAFAGQPFVVMAAATLKARRLTHADVDAGRSFDDILDEIAAEAESFVFGSGSLDAQGRASWQLEAPAGSKTLHLSVAVLDAEGRISAVATTAIPVR